jgi:hypothetical protein
MKKIYYEKKGRRYVPVAEYDSDYLDSFPKGDHLVSCYPGGKSRRFHIDPNYAAMIAAGRVAEDVISDTLVKASELRMQSKDRNRKLTLEQKAAWENLVEVFGDDARYLERASMREVAEEGVKAMIQEAHKLMEYPSVKKAYEHFMLVCELTKETNE